MTDYRYELKFVLDQTEFGRAKSWLLMHTTAKRAHPSRFVNTVYFDDPGYSSARDNLAGIPVRRKLRLRWYHDGDQSSVNSPSFEAKFRQGRLGHKDRNPLLHLDERLLETTFNNLYKDIQADIGGDNVFLSDAFLFPTLHVSYRRDYYEGLDHIRVTFDQMIQFFNPLPHLKLFQNPPISYSKIIMEIKFSQGEKDRIAASLRKFNMTPKRHSKYMVGLAALGLVVYF